MEGRKRTVQVKFYVTEEERRLIREKMKLIPTRNMAAYLRKMAIDGYVVHIDTTDIRAQTAELQKIGVNVNQIARRINSIIDEIGHCEFDKECTRMFFDLIDRRYNKEGNFNMIFTSNKNPALWREDFNEDTTLLCALDRIFDDAMVFKLRGESFRGKKLETISLQTGKVKAVESVTEMKG